MKKSVYSILLLLLLAGAFMAGSWYNQRAGARKSGIGGRKVLYYVDPMHPAYKSDKPGIAPDCGMQLEPVYADGGLAAPGAGNGSSSQPPGALNISPEKQQRIGVRVSVVEKAAGRHTLRLLGRVAPDETRIYKLVAGVDGFVRQVSAVTTGSHVQKDQWLATFSAPDARAPIQAFLVTLGVLDHQKQGSGDAPAQVKAATASSQLAIDRLLNMGMSVVQIEEIRRTRELPTDIKILAPAAGFVLGRSVSPGQRFEKGAEWFRIADLNRVWILADVFQKESRYIRPGQSARVTLPAEGATFRARVSEILPQFDAATRTLKVRLEADNPAYTLRPDMFVDVELSITLPPTIAVPVDAVLDSGLKKTVFVDRGEGHFEPRQVEIGWRFGDRVEIASGLQPGERIVTSGNFLLDSESRMKRAVGGIQGKQASKDPVCGMDLDAGTARYMEEHGGTRYYFCSQRCQQDFHKDPERYLKNTTGGNHQPVARARS